MDEQQLQMLAGEQLILQKKRDELQAADHRDKASLLTLVNSASTATAAWLHGGIALLTRVHETRTKLGEMDQRLAELKKLTGL